MRFLLGLPTSSWVLLLSLLLQSGSAAGQGSPAKETFASTCASCHGENGKGNPAVANTLHVPDLTSKTVQKRSNKQLRTVIESGRRNMPPFKSTLSSDQIDSLVKYVRSLRSSRK